LEYLTDCTTALVTIAALCAIIFSVLQTITTHFGGGLPEAVVSEQNERQYLKVCSFLWLLFGRSSLIRSQLDIVSRVFYFICNWSVKHSLLFFYSELTIDRCPRHCIYAMHVIAFAFGCTCIGATIFQCSPMPKIWDEKIDGHCINIDTFNYFNSCFMLATDLVLYTMPLVFTRKLHLRRPQRIAVNLLFTLGGLVLAASGARVYFVYAQGTKPDFIYRSSATMVCAVIENHVAIIVSCAPSIKMVILRAFPNLQEKFERIVSRNSKEDEGFRGSAIATLNVESDMREVKEQDVEYARPLAFRILTDDSTMSKDSRMGKWWRAPSSWAVNVA
jgi:hypothetical protein